MALLYIDEADASLNRGEVAAGETISEGELVVPVGGGEYRRADPTNDELPTGIVVHDAAGDSIVEHDEEYVAYDDLWTYEAGENFYYQPLASVDNIMPRTLADNGADPEPSIRDGAVVGYVTINGNTELVESGYVANDGTEYSESGAGDFVAIGRVDQYPQNLRIDDAFHIRVPTRLDADVFTTA